MKNGMVLLIMLFIFSTPAVRWAGAEDFEVPPSSVNAEELRGIRDRLATSLFFKGELADNIIKSGLQNRLVGMTGRETYSEVRSALIAWIKTNPDQAANIYFYLESRQPGAGKPPEVINYQMPSWVINPHFLELVQGVNRVAKDAAITDEEMSLVAQRLFEAAQTQPEAYAPWIPNGAAAQGAGGAGSISYADYRLNPASVERERRTLGGWFENVKSAAEAEISGAGKEKSISPQRRILEETFSIYRDFLVALSGLKGRIKITREEAVQLEALRQSLRKNLGELETLSAMRKINERAQALPPLSPGSKILKDDARRIEEGFKVLLADLRGNPESVKSAGSRFYELKKVFDFWTLRFSAHGRLSDLKNRIAERRFSCVFDKFVFKYLSRFHPSADYARLAAGGDERSKALDISLEGVAAGDYETASFFSLGAKKSLSGNILEAERDAARLEAYSRFNRRIQFFFWDAFVNPFGLGPGPKGISARNNLLF